MSAAAAATTPAVVSVVLARFNGNPNKENEDDVLPPLTRSKEEMKQMLLRRENKADWLQLPWQKRFDFDSAADWTRRDSYPWTSDASEILHPIMSRCNRSAFKYYRQRNEGCVTLPAMEAYLSRMLHLPIFESRVLMANMAKGVVPLSISSKTETERLQLELAMRKEANEKKETRFIPVATEVERLFRAVRYTATHVAKQRAYCLGEDVELPQIPAEWIESRNEKKKDVPVLA